MTINNTSINRQTPGATARSQSTGLPIQKELRARPRRLPVYASRHPFSTDEIECARTMLGKLQRREDVATSQAFDFDDLVMSSTPIDSENVLNAVVAKLIDIL